MLTELVTGEWFDELMPISVTRTKVEWTQNQYLVQFGEEGSLCKIDAKSAPGIEQLILIQDEDIERAEPLPNWIKNDELIQEAKRAIKYLKNITETHDCPVPDVVREWGNENITPPPTAAEYEYRGIARTAFVLRYEESAQLSEIEYKFPQTAPITSRAIMYQLKSGEHTFYVGFNPAKRKIIWFNVDPPEEGFELVLKAH